MALISIYVDDGDYSTILDAVASYHQWGGETSSGSKEEFLNGVVRGFLQESVRAYEVSEARRAAEEAVAALPLVPLENAEVYKPHYYYMICKAAYKAQYDYMASNLMPGLSFDLPLTDSPTSGEVTHYAMEGAFTEFQRHQLATLEATGATGARGILNLFYVRCDVNRLFVYSNFAAASEFSGNILLGDVIENLGLYEV